MKIGKLSVSTLWLRKYFTDRVEHVILMPPTPPPPKKKIEISNDTSDQVNLSCTLYMSYFRLHLRRDVMLCDTGIVIEPTQSATGQKRAL